MLEMIRNHPATVCFDDVIAYIGEHYHYTPGRFTNGVDGDQVISEAGQNEGSCKIFSFAKANQLTEAETLACFGKYYRDDVLGHPEGSDHANIRTFMRHGWAGISFDGVVLQRK